MSKLQNIKAIKQLLAGEHRTQTRKSFSMVGSDKRLEKFVKSVNGGKNHLARRLFIGSR